jgi:hypothetical protein
MEGGVWAKSQVLAINSTSLRIITHFYLESFDQFGETQEEFKIYL